MEKRNQSLSPFAESALALDGELTQFEKLAAEMERLDLNSDKGMARAGTILTDINNCRTRLESTMNGVVTTLAEAQKRNTQGEATVARNTELFIARKRDADRLMEKLKTIGESVRGLNKTVGEVKITSVETLTPDERVTIVDQINESTNPLDHLVNETSNLVEEARSLNMRLLERNADTLRQSLQSAKNRLKLLVDRLVPPESRH
ncbi:MAG: hypothetical protein HYR96_07125 [Deltaproteobacteria bacterium]|nr:hypothetical protein [Deltaproteobacteria bacterium]